MIFSGIDNGDGSENYPPVAVLGDGNDGDDPPVEMLDDEDGAVGERLSTKRKSTTAEWHVTTLGTLGLNKLSDPSW